MKKFLAGALAFSLLGFSFLPSVPDPVGVTAEVIACYSARGATVRVSWDTSLEGVKYTVASVAGRSGSGRLANYIKGSAELFTQLGSQRIDVTNWGPDASTPGSLTSSGTVSLSVDFDRKDCPKK